MVINTLTGALAVRILDERPLSFCEHRSCGMPTVLLMPHFREDFEAVTVSESGAVLPCPVMSAIVASHVLSLRGLPLHSISVISEGERYEVPFADSKNSKNCRYPIKCKQIYSKTVAFSGGMENILYTDGGKNRTRIIEAPSEIDFSRELLCRLKIMEGLPDAVRSVAYRRVGGVWRMASTDTTLTLDSVVALVGLAAHLGARGEVMIACRGIEFEFTVPEREPSLAYISSSLLFGY